MTSQGEAPARGPGRRRNREQTRLALLNAAADTFARRGYTQASLEEIAETAGFTRGAVHHHFGSKEELFMEVIARRDEELLAGYEPTLRGSKFDASSGAARWQELHGDARSEVALRLELRSHALRSEALRRRFVEVEAAAAEATATRLAKDAAESGLVWRHPPEVVADLLHAASHAAAEQAALTGESSQYLMEAFTDLIWNGAFEPERKD